MKLFSVYDKKAAEFGPLFESKNEDVAIRQFKNMLSGERVYAPEDYNLYCLGSFDREKGEVVSERSIVFSGETLLNKKLEVVR